MRNKNNKPDIIREDGLPKRNINQSPTLGSSENSTNIINKVKTERFDDLSLLSITAAARIMKVGTARIYHMIENKEVGVIELNSTIRIPYVELKRWQENKIKHSAIFDKPNERGLITRNTSTNPKEIMRSIKKSKVRNE